MASVHDEEDERVERLLAGGYLSGSEYDAIEERVLAASATKTKAKPALRWAAGTFATLSLAALMLLWVRAPAVTTPEFTSKGGAAVTSGGLDITCKQAVEHQCKAGDTLLFLANTAVAAGYLGGYAERVGDPAHPRIWYFPSARGTSPRVDRGDGTHVLAQGVRIGSEHAPGQYRVTLWLTTRPLTRDEVAHAAPSSFVARHTLIVEVVP